MDPQPVQLEWPRPEVALVRLNRPERLNAFDTAMAEAVAACFAVAAGALATAWLLLHPTS